MFQWTRAAIALILAMLKLDDEDGVNGVLLGSKILLYTNVVAPNPLVTLADFTEATYGGYARSAAIVFDDPFISTETGAYVMAGDLKTFTASGNVPNETVRGWALISSDVSPVLLGYKAMDENWTPAAGSEMKMIPRVALPDLATLPDTDPALM